MENIMSLREEIQTKLATREDINKKIFAYLDKEVLGAVSLGRYNCAIYDWQLIAVLKEAGVDFNKFTDFKEMLMQYNYWLGFMVSYLSSNNIEVTASNIGGGIALEASWKKHNTENE
jgi:hypothetical protein